MNRYYLGWAVWLLVGVAYELWAWLWRKAPGDTLSEFTGRVFNASSLWGWYALMFLMGFLAAWYPQHVRRLAKEHRATVIVLPPPTDGHADDSA